MKVSAAAAAAPCLSEHRVVSLCRAGSPPSPPPRSPLPLCPEQAAAAASLLMDMKGCYSRLAGLVPTLPRHRRVSKVEILQHVIDYIADLQLELQHPLGAAPAAAASSSSSSGSSSRAAQQPAGAAAPEVPCVNADDRILCR